MNISFNLKDPSKRSSIRVVVTNNGKVFRKSTGLTIDPKFWSKSKQKAGIPDIEDKLKSIRIKLESALNENSTGEWIETCMAKAIAGEDVSIVASDTKVPTFWEFFEEWSNKECSAKRQRQLAYRNIRKLMGDNDNWEGINKAYYHRLCRLMSQQDWSINYQGLMLKYLKTVMHEGFEFGYHKNEDFWSFKKLQEASDSIYLNEDEMEAIWNVKLKNEMDKKARDLAWLGYLTCARFSDYSRLTMDNIGSDGKIRFVQQKTNDKVVLPCSPRVVDILSRYGGKAPKLAEQNYNTAIKNVCRLAGITDMVERKESKGDMHVRKEYLKYELVSSHTFRRSAATNLYLRGVPLRSIMHLTGHKSIAMLEKYLKVGREENADILTGNAFFQ